MSVALSTRTVQICVLLRRCGELPVKALCKERSERGATITR
jgi:hypothetical protein